MAVKSPKAWPCQSGLVSKNQPQPQALPTLNLDTLSLQTTKHQSTQQTHDAIEVSTLEVNSKLKELVESGRLSLARQLFDKLPHRDEVTWTTVVGGYINAFDTSEALSLFSKMWVDPTVHMDPFILSLALKACGLSSNARHGNRYMGIV